MKCYGSVENNNVIGVVGPYNPYPDGEIYYSYNEGLSWIPLSDLTNKEIENIDACFVTYGK